MSDLAASCLGCKSLEMDTENPAGDHPELDMEWFFCCHIDSPGEDAVSLETLVSEIPYRPEWCPGYSPKDTWEDITTHNSQNCVELNIATGETRETDEEIAVSCPECLHPAGGHFFICSIGGE